MLACVVDWGGDTSVGGRASRIKKKFQTFTKRLAMLNPTLEVWVNVSTKLGVAANNVECESWGHRNGFGVVRRHEGVHGEGFSIVPVKDLGSG